MAFIKKYLLSPFQNDWKFLLVLSLPAVLLCTFGLNQLDRLTVLNFAAAGCAKLVCEFLFLGALLSLLNFYDVQ